MPMSLGLLPNAYRTPNIHASYPIFGVKKLRKYDALLRPRVRRPIFGWTALACTFFIFLIVAAAGHRQRVRNSERAELQARRATASAESARLRPAARPVSADETKQTEALWEERAFPWEGVFEAIEAAASEDIELLDFSPDKQHKRFVLRGEARDHAALLAYLGALSSQPRLRNVYVSRRNIVERDKLVTIEFELHGGLD
jgi:hypothetical protein